MAFVLAFLLLSPLVLSSGAQDLRSQPVKVIISDTCVQDESGEKEMLLEPGSPLVLTHRIRLVSSTSLGSGSGCQCELDFAALRERMERLEKEVSDLREKCGGPDGCCSSQQSKGSVCTTGRPETDDHPDDCSDQGRCVDGKCVCFPGFNGPDCSVPDCPGDCSNRGRCVNGQCVCDPGFSGPDCSGKTCPENCNNHGRCVNGKCVCDSGFAGQDCSVKTCPDDCSNRGHCLDGKCVCESGLTGPDCSSSMCPGDCSDRGRCVNGRCVCESEFTGPDCSSRSCPGACSDRGQCVNGQCVCESGFTGPDCSSQACPGNCNSKGRCVDGKCVCDVGFSGQNCSSKTCPNSCSDRGRCVRGRCVCRRGFTGPDCSECQSGLTGENCDTALLAVSRLSTRNISESSVTLSWTPAAVQYDTFLISFTSTKETDQKIISRISGRLNTYSQVGLAAGQEYMVSVTGEKDGMMGMESTTKFTTLISGPKDLHVVKTSTTTVVFQWEKAQGEIDRYVLSIAPNQTEGSVRLPEMFLAPERDSAQIQGLQPGRLYDISLVAERDGVRSRPATVQATPGNVSVPETRMSMRTDNVQVDLEPGNNREKIPRLTNTTLILRKQVLSGQLTKGKVENSERTWNTSRLKPGVPLRPGQKRPLPVRRHGMLPKPGTQPEITRRPYRPGVKHFNSSQMGVKGVIVGPSSNRSVTENDDSAYPVSVGKPLELTMKETRSQTGDIATMFRRESVQTPRSSVHKLTSTPLPFTTEEPIITTEKKLTAYINGTKCVRKVLVGYRKIHGNMSDGNVLSKNLSIIVGHVNGNELLHKLLMGESIVNDMDETNPNAETSEARRSVKEQEEVQVDEEVDENNLNATPYSTRRPETIMSFASTSPHVSTSAQPETGNPHTARDPPTARRNPIPASSLSVPRLPTRPKHTLFMSPYSSSSLELQKEKRPSWPSSIASGFTKEALVETKVFPATREIQESSPELPNTTPLPVKFLSKQDSAIKNTGIEASDVMPFRQKPFRGSDPRRPNVNPFQNRTRPVLEPPQHPSRGPMRRAFLSKPIMRNNRTFSPVRPVKPALTSATENNTSVRMRPNAGINRTDGAASTHSQIQHIGTTQVGPNISPYGKGNSDRSFSNNETQEYVLSDSDGSVEHVRVVNALSTALDLTWPAPEQKFKHFRITQTELGPENKEKDEIERDEEADGRNGEEEGDDGLAERNSLSKGKAAVHEPNARSSEMKKGVGNTSTVLPGSARSHHMTDLSPRTRYSVSIFGKGPAFRSKTHSLIIHTGTQNQKPTLLTLICSCSERMSA